MSWLAGALGAGINMVGGLFGNMFSRDSNRETNETNMKINQMNNQFNAAEAEKMRQWQANEWNRQFNLTNEYNTAAAQRRRLEDAGLNPFLMMQGGNAGTAVAQSGMSGATAGAAPPLSMQAWRPDLSFLNSMGDIIAQSDVRSATVSKLGADKNLADAKALEALGNTDWTKMTKEARNALKQQGVARAELGLAREQQELNLMHTKDAAMRAEMALNLTRAEAQQVLNKFLPAQQRSEIALKAAHLYQAVAAGDLSREKVETEIANQIKLAAEAEGHRISNQVARETSKALIDATNASNGYYNSYYNTARNYARGQASTDYLNDYYEMKFRKKGNQSYWVDRGANWIRDIGNSIGNIRPNRRTFNTYNTIQPPKL